MLARDVHALLRGAWAAPLKASGWTRSKLSPSAWTLATAIDAVSFWVQIDKYGWWDGFGSELTVEFQYDAGAPSAEPGQMQNRARYARFLSDTEITTVLAANTDVRTSLPADPPAVVPGFDPYPQDFEAETLTSDQVRRSDLWMRYYRPEHVQWIADFLLPRIDTISQQLRDRCRAHAPLST